MDEVDCCFYEFNVNVFGQFGKRQNENITLIYWTKEKTSNRCIKDEDKENTQKKKRKNNVRK